VPLKIARLSSATFSRGVVDTVARRRLKAVDTRGEERSSPQALSWSEVNGRHLSNRIWRFSKSMGSHPE
jgi:hypothetical protein